MQNTKIHQSCQFFLEKHEKSEEKQCQQLEKAKFGRGAVEGGSRSGRGAVEGGRGAVEGGRGAVEGAFFSVVYNV